MAEFNRPNNGLLATPEAIVSNLNVTLKCVKHEYNEETDLWDVELEEEVGPDQPQIVIPLSGAENEVAHFTVGQIVNLRAELEVVLR